MPGEDAPPIGATAIVRFVSELALFASLAYFGAQIGSGALTSTVLAVALPLAAIAVWGTFIGPQARLRLTDPTRFGVELVLFAIGGLGLVVYGQWPFAVGLVLLYAAGTPRARAG